MIKVSVAVINKDGKFLIAKRVENDPLRDKWEFPGGKVEPGETPEECVRREVFEELGINVEIGEFICSIEHHYDHEPVELFAYNVQYTSGNLDSGYYQEMKWVKPGDLSSYEFPEANLPIVEKLVYG
jgi:mutator protein MutT